MGGRKVTVRFEGVDAYGHGFLFERTVDATAGGDNPRFYGQQAEEAMVRATSGIRDAVESNYGRPGGDS